MSFNGFFSVPLICMMASASSASENGITSNEKVVVCYIGSWSTYRPDSGQFTWENIDPTLCTHLIYSFAGLDENTFTIHSLDPFLDLEDNGGRAQYKKVIGLKSRNPQLKVTVALGGWNEGSGKYSLMASNSNSRKSFVESAVNFVRKHGFDGLDMDWKYPGKREGSRPEDKENFVLLLKELRKEFDRYGYLLTAAAGAPPDIVKAAYNVSEISKSVDFIHLMCYDYHGSWDGKIGHNAPLRSSANDNLSLEDTISLFVQLGAPRNKLVLGVPFYGRTFLLNDINARTVNVASAKPAGFAGPFTREEGFLGYNEICLEMKNSRENPWTQTWDGVAQVPILERDDRWISYDDERSIKIKTGYAYSEGLAGVMIWSIDTDDFRGECSPRRYPLLRTINEVLGRLSEKDNEISPVKPTEAQKPVGAQSSATALDKTPLLLMLFFCFPWL